MDSHTKEALDKILTSISELSSRIQAIEVKSEQDSIAQVQPPPSLSNPAPATADEHAVEVDIHTAFSAIRAAHQQIKLPSSLIVPTDKTGINKKDQPVINLLTKSAKFAETGLKIIQSPSSGSDTKVQELLTVLTSFVITLQEEHAAIVVQGTFDDGVARFFRSLQRTNNFTPEALENLRAAASIASAYRPRRGQSTPGFQNNRGFQSQQRFGGRGRGRGAGGRGFYHQQQSSAMAQDDS